MSSESILKFYKFCTGCNRVPIDGFKHLRGTRNKYQKFCIESLTIKDKNGLTRLIEANTCFNRIYMPVYESKEIMTKVFHTIVDNVTNYFGKQ